MKGYHVNHPSTPTLPAQTPSPEICGALEKPMPCSVWMSWCSGTSSAVAGLQSLRFGEGKYSLTLDQRARERSRNGGVLQEEM
ncbi:hypothetical protein NC651_022820 [Populus alba x Populus x berolinensis]|nr:hypothetical protein NC651_022820 [Populus alba x Populus x berolinensis]